MMTEIETESDDGSKTASVNNVLAMDEPGMMKVTEKVKSQGEGIAINFFGTTTLNNVKEEPVAGDEVSEMFQSSC